jgi:hypothetical protein
MSRAPRAEISLHSGERLGTDPIGAPADTARIVPERLGDVADRVVLDAETALDVLATQMECLRG